jgi:hypothetical protein
MESAARGGAASFAPMLTVLIVASGLFTIGLGLVHFVMPVLLAVFHVVAAAVSLS